MSYIDYKHKIEFGKNEYDEIAKYCSELEIDWFASCWDRLIKFSLEYEPPVLKLASHQLLIKIYLKHMFKQNYR